MIVKASSRGDILQALCILEHLKILSKGCEIDWVIEKPFCEVVLHHKEIHNVFVIDTKKWKKGWLKSRKEVFSVFKALRKNKYDVVFDLQGNVKSAIVTFFAKAKKKLGFKNPREWPNKLVTKIKFDPPYLNIRCDYVGMIYHYFQKRMPKNITDHPLYFEIEDQEKQKIDMLFEKLDLAEKKKVLICPQSAWENKRLSNDTLLELMEKMHHQTPCFFFISWGNEKEKKQACDLAVHPNTFVIERYLLTTLHYLMQQVDFVIAMDSISLHMAATANIKTLSIFGSTSANYYAPKGPFHQSIQGRCPYHITFKKQCPKMRSCTTGGCMKDLKSEDIFQAFEFENALTQSQTL